MNQPDKAIAELLAREDFPGNAANSVPGLVAGRKVILYGAGEAGAAFLQRVAARHSLLVYAVLDRKFKKGDSYAGIPAFNPDDYSPTEDEKRGSVVVVSVFKRECLGEIIGGLEKKGFKRIVPAIEFYDFQLFNIPASLRERGFEFYRENRGRILACSELFKDEMSRNVYSGFIRNHLERKPVPIPSRPISEQYFPSDIKLNKGYSRFINCGSLNGDTVMRLNSVAGKVDAVACFEPDLRNFGLLCEYLAKNRSSIADNLVAFPCGVHSTEAQFRFSGGNTCVSAISEEGDSLIQCVAIDHVLPGFAPTFLNMDVEGAELEALRGAERLIRESSPDLAISIYHSPEHAWEIPLYLHGLGLGYNFYLRNYTSFTSDTVLYATV